MAQIFTFFWLLAGLILVNGTPTYYLSPIPNLEIYGEFGIPWQNQGFLGTSLPPQAPRTADVVPLRSFESPNYDDITYFYTLDTTEAQHFVNDLGFREYTSEFLVYNAPGPGRPALYRFFGPVANIYVYSTNPDEIAWLIAQPENWTNQGIICYLAPDGTNLYRYHRD